MNIAETAFIAFPDTKEQQRLLELPVNDLIEGLKKSGSREHRILGLGMVAILLSGEVERFDQMSQVLSMDDYFAPFQAFSVGVYEHMKLMFNDGLITPDEVIDNIDAIVVRKYPVEDPLHQGIKFRIGILMQLEMDVTKKLADK